MTLKFYNTLTKKKEEFVPQTPGKVGMYVCGVTVYDYCHLGHARGAVIFDVIYNYLNYKGYEIIYVRNFTDIDDKIINRAKERCCSTDELASTFIDEYYHDMGRLGVKKADIEPKATEHISEIIKIVVSLVEKGMAYAVNGDVFFRINKFLSYGKLSGRKLDEMLAGARVEVDSRKENPLDFVLWKGAKKGEPSWDSPWGLGRPGWHIECSAMSMKYLGESFDIHGGGKDLIFPHHENEIAQSEGFSGKKPFARYWLHNGFVTINKEKMSKSLGNFFTIKEILDKYEPEAVRLFLLSTHYRNPIDFSDQQLKDSTKALHKFYNCLRNADRILGRCQGNEQQLTSNEQRLTSDGLDSYIRRFAEAMNDDINTPVAIALLFDIVKEINLQVDKIQREECSKTALEKTVNALEELGEVLGLGFKNRRERDVLLKKKLKEKGSSPEDVERLVADRYKARKNKDWTLADTLRNQLVDIGIQLDDYPDGTVWYITLARG
ncbi:MAG: cysteine--tRNA ligase [bacterium]